eukprot:CAMPEP_0119481702 /NCGR_PEP_ID=MMETSP1344-20130328/9913_1 /TAXON_ID=236787 /ORGANISM="Florenciella parvula, Strain CCMP2471" /LENGTH=1246 /DNA_ID=CAMNT_0007516079 /DNA_START=58 /DNA_END=3794 /DNA_ORIENTATION=-
MGKKRPSLGRQRKGTRCHHAPKRTPPRNNRAGAGDARDGEDEHNEDTGRTAQHQSEDTIRRAPPHEMEVDPAPAGGAEQPPAQGIQGTVVNTAATNSGADDGERAAAANTAPHDCEHPQSTNAQAREVEAQARAAEDHLAQHLLASINGTIASAGRLPTEPDSPAGDGSQNTSPLPSPPRIRRRVEGSIGGLGEEDDSISDSDSYLDSDIDFDSDTMSETQEMGAGQAEHVQRVQHADSFVNKVLDPSYHLTNLLLLLKQKAMRVVERRFKNGKPKRSNPAYFQVSQETFSIAASAPDRIAPFSAGEMHRQWERTSRKVDALSRPFRQAAHACSAFIERKMGPRGTTSYFSFWYIRQTLNDRIAFLEQNPKMRDDVARQMASAQRALEKGRRIAAETLIMKCRDRFSLKQLFKIRQSTCEQYNPQTQRFEDRYDNLGGVNFRRLTTIAKTLHIRRERQRLLADFAVHGWYNPNPRVIYVCSKNPPHRGWTVPFEELIRREIKFIFESDEHFQFFNYMSNNAPAGYDGLLLFGIGLDGFPLKPDGATLGAAVCLNLGSVSCMSENLRPYLMYLGDEGDDHALEALRDYQRFFEKCGGEIEVEVKKRPRGLGPPDMATPEEAAANLAARASDGDDDRMTVKFKLRSIGRFDLKAKIKGNGGAGFSSKVLGSGQVPMSVFLNSCSEFKFRWEPNPDLDLEAEFKREWDMDEDGIACAVIQRVSYQQLLKQAELADAYAQANPSATEDQLREWAYNRNHAFIRRKGQASVVVPELLSSEPWVDPLHCEINVSDWALDELFDLARMLGDAANIPIGDADHPAQRFIHELGEVPAFKTMAERFSNRLKPATQFGSTEIRASGNHAILLHQVLPRLRRNVFEPACKTDTQKLAFSVLDIVMLAERHVFKYLRATTLMRADVDDVKRTGRMILRLLSGQGHKVTYNLWISFALCPALLDLSMKEFPHEDASKVHGLAYLASTQAHERLNQVIKDQARFTSRREGWTEELRNNVTIAHVLAYLHEDVNVQLHVPTKETKRYPDNFDAENAARPDAEKLCRSCTGVLDGTAAPITRPASAHIKKVLCMHEPLCSSCAARLEVIHDIDVEDGRAASASWVGQTRASDTSKFNRAARRVSGVNEAQSEVVARRQQMVADAWDAGALEAGQRETQRYVHPPDHAEREAAEELQESGLPHLEVPQEMIDDIEAGRIDEGCDGDDSEVNAVVAAVREDAEIEARRIAREREAREAARAQRR